MLVRGLSIILGVVFIGSTRAGFSGDGREDVEESPTSINFSAPSIW